MSASALRVAYVTLTQVFARTSVHCPDCRHWLMTVPGQVVVRVRALANLDAWRGAGRIVTCRWCKHKCEVIEHG